MKLSTITLSLASIFTLLALSIPIADAAEVDRRQRRQKARIKRGVKNGSIAKSEAKRLQRNNRRIRRAERQAKADGQLDAQERRRLNQLQNTQSRRIFKTKHNNLEQQENGIAQGDQAPLRKRKLRQKIKRLKAKKGGNNGDTPPTTDQQSDDNTVDL